MPTPPTDAFLSRHLGPSDADVTDMLATLGLDSLDALIDQTIPAAIRSPVPDGLPASCTETEAIEELAERAGRNAVLRSYLGLGYHGTITPPVVLRNVIENPGWYTAYTPYQAEISQGRLEALLVYQTVIQELTGMEIANASLLDEATAAAEAMTMAHRISDGKRDTFFVDERCHPQTIAVVRTRAEPLGIHVSVGRFDQDADLDQVYGALLPYPCTDGSLLDLPGACARARDAKVVVTVVADLLALTLLKSPGELGAEIVVGSSQRFGVPLGFGGPHAGFMATLTRHQRQMPGRIIGISKDVHGDPALRMALQTREQHIRRQKATSNICTAQVLLAVTAAFYAVWHGPEGLRRIAGRVHCMAKALAEGARAAGWAVSDAPFFDTVRIRAGGRQQDLLDAALSRGINLRVLDEDVVVALDETVTESDLQDLLEVFGSRAQASDLLAKADPTAPGGFERTTGFLRQSVFHAHRSETEMLRYLHRLQVKDLSLDASMIPLGSCTMKLNATTEMIPVTWPGFNALHPFAPSDQTQGYAQLFAELEGWLCAVTGFDAVSLQPNAGSQGEYAGLLAIREYHRSRGDHDQRMICLIPQSAHGTNPASAVMAGMEVVVVACDDHGNIDVSDLRRLAEQHAERLGALMVTYPSTHGVFEESIREVCAVVHKHGGQVYMDGANMNAMVGLCRPGDIGADVCHLNLHKTFCIPHGGGGPGMGPIGVRAHLAPFLPGHPVVAQAGRTDLGPVSAAPWGSPSILPISWAYIRMLGGEGLKRATEVAILNANYLATLLDEHFPVLYKGANGRVAHECILDLRPFKNTGVIVDDVAKRLMDYGFHAPTMSFPVPGTLMVEPTESESKAELDRFVQAMIAIRAEIREIEEGRVAIADSALRHAPHTAGDVTGDVWDRPYTRSQAAFPTPHTRAHKYWPTVGRIDNAAGDRHLICTCDAWPDH
ncbi:MAG: aminomethyl-transferring glycine dehydrogenase [Alphaproteobacteria bacterium]|nr:aminomethyl-transferring glycine dehydrogenase [Alphaproteobacteria bacterium]